MELFVVDNIAKILPNEKSVLDVFRDRIRRAIQQNQQISFRIAVGFFFFEGFQKLYPELKELYDRNLLKEFKLVMGPETRRTTKEVLEALKNDARELEGETFHFIKKLYDEKKFDFRIFLERNFHIKLYLFEIGNEIEIWAGSANLTESGLEENIELIVPTAALTFEDKDLYRKFFDEIWKRSTDEVENLRVIDIIREASISEVVYLHPRDFIINLIKILGKEYLLKNITTDLSYLGEFQNISYYLCRGKLEKYGGAILANSFGLGKTDVGCVIAKEYVEMGKKVLIIYPPVIEYHWEETLKKVGLKLEDVKLLSRGMLHKREFDYEKYQNIDLIIVDEAHHFRISNPKSNRRKNLEDIIKINPNSHVLLITATPINTSLLDFIELLKLFLKGRYKEIFESEGILLKMREIEKSVKEKIITHEIIEKFDKLIRIFTVRIEWPDLPLYFKEDLRKIAGVSDIEKPDVFAIKYKYDEEIAKGIFDKVVPFLSKLNFEYTKLWEKEYKEDKNLIWWYKWRLYKRLESSLTAFRISLGNILDKNNFLLDFLTKISFNPNYTKTTELFSKERLENIKITFLSLSNSKRKRVLERIEKDIIEIEKMLQNIKQIRNLEKRDEKVNKLIEILEKERKPTLIFSESRDTVIYIGERLKELGKFKFELAYGGELPIDEESGEKLKEANKEKIEREFNKGKFDILVSTDIMGEGVNLPRADVVINFDLHYNPVKLIQRDGRAIRINNPKKITIYNFEPDERIDKELELCDKLAKRVENIISTIGLDFLIWSIEEGKLDEVSEKNRKRTEELIREYRHELATKHPEELGRRVLPKLSEEDKVLREFIKVWNISEESLTKVRTYKKPIFTALRKQATNDYFIAFKYRSGIHTIGELSFSENKREIRLSENEMEKIKSLIVEKCLELDREFLKISYERKDKITTQIEKFIEKLEGLKDAFDGIDIMILPRNDKYEILKTLKNIEKLPPWKRDDEIKKLKNILNEKIKSRGYQKSLEEPKLLAVIKYD
jgi:superfamily II DNA/RNA helicase